MTFCVQCGYLVRRPLFFSYSHCFFFFPVPTTYESFHNVHESQFSVWLSVIAFTYLAKQTYIIFWQHCQVSRVTLSLPLLTTFGKGKKLFSVQISFFAIFWGQRESTILTFLATALFSYHKMPAFCGQLVILKCANVQIPKNTKKKIFYQRT